MFWLMRLLNRCFSDTDQAEEHDQVQLDASDGTADGKYSPVPLITHECCEHCQHGVHAPHTLGCSQ